MALRSFSRRSCFPFQSLSLLFHSSSPPISYLLLSRNFSKSFKSSPSRSSRSSPSSPSPSSTSPSPSRSSPLDFKNLPDEYAEVMYGRRNREREDSLTVEMLSERVAHKKRMDQLEKPSELSLSLGKMGHGKKTRLPNVYLSLEPTPESWMSKTAPRTGTGAGGLAEMVGSATHQWPLLKHMLPEIAFAGHSNAGKSTLVNAMIGYSPRNGIAGVSERAGWTDQINFYQLGKKPPLLTLVDLPGYGHAVASPIVLRTWKEMTHNYMRQRLILSRVYVLVDCMRGLCDADKSTLNYLHKHNIPWKIILTKCDHLPADGVARSLLLVYRDISHLITPHTPSSSSPLSSPISPEVTEKEEQEHSEKIPKIPYPIPDVETSPEEEEQSMEDVEKQLNQMMETLRRGNKTNNNSKRSSPSSSPSRAGQRVPTVSRATEEMIDSDGVIYTPSLAPRDEYRFSHSGQRGKLDEDDEEEAVEGAEDPVAITTDGEILGGYKLDYNNLTVDQYKTITRSGRDRQKIAEERRLKDIEEKGESSVEPIEIDESSGDEDEGSTQNLATPSSETTDIDANENGEEEDDEGERETLKQILKHILPVSATTGAGVAELWEDIRVTVNGSVSHPLDWERRSELSPERVKELLRVVREHKRAMEERRRISIAQRDRLENSKRETRGPGGSKKK